MWMSRARVVCVVDHIVSRSAGFVMAMFDGDVTRVVLLVDEDDG